MCLLIWLIILSSLCNWLVNHSLQLQKVKYYLLISLPFASRLHYNSNLSYFAMDIFSSVRMFCIFTLEYCIYLECKGYSRPLKWSRDEEEGVTKNEKSNPLERYVPESPLPCGNPSFSTLQMPISVRNHLYLSGIVLLLLGYTKVTTLNQNHSPEVT